MQDELGMDQMAMRQAQVAPESMDMEFANQGAMPTEEDMMQFLPPEVLRELERAKVKEMLKQVRQKELQEEMRVLEESRMKEIEDESMGLFDGQAQG